MVVALQSVTKSTIVTQNKWWPYWLGGMAMGRGRGRGGGARGGKCPPELSNFLTNMTWNTIFAPLHKRQKIYISQYQATCRRLFNEFMLFNKAVGPTWYWLKKNKKITTLLPLNRIGIRTSIEFYKKKSIYNANSARPPIKDKKNYFQTSFFLWISEFLYSF